MISEEFEKAKNIIKKYNGEIIKDYTLINNYGIVFELNENKYDARHWFNIYGESVNFYSIGGMKKDNEKILNKIEKELNEMIGEL